MFNVQLIVYFFFWKWGLFLYWTLSPEYKQFRPGQIPEEIALCQTLLFLKKEKDKW